MVVDINRIGISSLGDSEHAAQVAQVLEKKSIEQGVPLLRGVRQLLHPIQLDQDDVSQH